MENPFQILVGEQLSSVIFVRDYLQLDFDVHILSCYVWPRVKIENEIVDFGSPDYRNRLCLFIAKIVEHTELIEGQKIEIHFQSGEQLEIILDSLGGETVYFTTVDNTWSSI